MTRAAVVATLALALSAVAGLAWWASRATLTPSLAVDVPQEGAQQVVWAQATSGSVGRSLPLSTTLRQPAVPVAQNTFTGVVTRVSPGEVDQGDVVYVVGDTPVRVVQGEVPFWRDLAPGAKGKDVAALQELLIDRGHLDGEADGDFGPGTLRAVRAWQKAEGHQQSGTVPLGELVAVPDLPAVVQLGEAVVVGQTLGGGEDAVLAPTGQREFVLVVTQDQARLIPAEATVEITYEGHEWGAVIAGSELDEFGSTTFELTGPDGGEVCGGECGVLPNDGQVTLRSEVVIVPRVEGTTVPAATVRTRADGTAYVTTESGEVDVTVVGSGQGAAVVDGLEPGARVQVLDGTPDAQPAPSGQPATGDGASSTRDG